MSTSSATYTESYSATPASYAFSTFFSNMQPITCPATCTLYEYDTVSSQCTTTIVTGPEVTLTSANAL